MQWFTRQDQRLEENIFLSSELVNPPMSLWGVRTLSLGATMQALLPSSGRFSFICGLKYWNINKTLESRNTGLKHQTVSSAKEANLFISVIISIILVSLGFLTVYSHLEKNNSVNNSTCFQSLVHPSSGCDQLRWRCTGNTRTIENNQWIHNRIQVKTQNRTDQKEQIH